MRKVYSLMIGISAYASPVSRLNGCVNDVNQLNNLFGEIFSDTNVYQYLPTIIIDSAATREAVIGAFSAFDQATNDDICIFYFSGHGSLVKTDPGYWKDGSQFLNSLVCYDSRLPGGYDLVDKEIAYLIWKSTKDKPKLHFVSIMDCCFAGSNTRDVTEISRMFTSNELVREPNQLLGFESYQNGLPPRGRYIAVSASQPYQTSKEKIISGNYHGIFTWFLCQVLQMQVAPTNYQLLVDRLSVLTRTNTREQEPMLEAFGMDGGSGIFAIESLPAISQWLMFYQSGWKINKGAVHGVIPGLELVFGNSQLARVDSVSASESQVSISPEPARETIYPVSPKTSIPVRLRFFVDDNTGTLASKLQQQIDSRSYEGIDFTEDLLLADYRVTYTSTGYFAMTNPEAGALPRFATVHPDSPGIFLERLQHVARWASVVNLSNLQGNSFAEKMQVELFAVINGVPTPVQDPSTHIFKYPSKPGVQAQPMFQLSLKNNSERPVHAFVLYCGCDFGVSDAILQNTTIDPTTTVRPRVRINEKISENLPIGIPVEYRKSGISRVIDFLVLVFSDSHISSAGLCLPDLPLESVPLNSVKRGVGSTRPTVPQPTWGTIRIPLIIEL